MCAHGDLENSTHTWAPMFARARSRARSSARMRLLLSFILSSLSNGLLPHRQRPLGSVVFLRHGATDWTERRTFTGWADPDISRTGAQQAATAALALKESGFIFDVVYTSVLKRAVHSTWLVLKELQQIHIEVHKDWRLNERSYGGITGQTVEQAIERHGADTVASWRRSFDARPPGYEQGHQYNPFADERYLRWQVAAG